VVRGAIKYGSANWKAETEGSVTDLQKNIGRWAACQTWDCSLFQYNSRRASPEMCKVPVQEKQKYFFVDSSCQL